jgi:hypothetical protein
VSIAIGAGFFRGAVTGNSWVFCADLALGLAADTDFRTGCTTFGFSAGFASALVLAAGFALFFPDDGFLETAIGAGSLPWG